ncbi:hypothetical protein J1N35_003207 [Gossypium stocksii]|uniref:Uncharacterized protein n=1 Tax=Gossypium stocksii TaxID=47602 RepID=A0A9D3WMN8_9ROSI|nr:hypothetical protein J1N35_003207 [Gossypium stocksii]
MLKLLLHSCLTSPQRYLHQAAVECIKVRDADRVMLCEDVKFPQCCGSYMLLLLVCFFSGFDLCGRWHGTMRRNFQIHRPMVLRVLQTMQWRPPQGHVLNLKLNAQQIGGVVDPT